MSDRSFVLQSPVVWASAVNYINALARTKKWEVVVRPYRKNRSAKQNSLMWRWLTIIGGELGYSKDEAHEMFKRRFLVPILVRDDAEFAELWSRVEQIGESIVETGMVKHLSTTDLNTAQFTEYLTEIERDAANLGINLPRPEDLYYEAMGYGSR